MKNTYSDEKLLVSRNLTLITPPNMSMYNHYKIGPFDHNNLTRAILQGSIGPPVSVKTNEIDTVLRHLIPSFDSQDNYFSPE